MKNNKEWVLMLKRLGWIAGLFAAAILVISAIEKKEASFTGELFIDIVPLEGGNKLITDEDIRTTIDRSFGFKLEGLPLVQLDVGRLERVLEADPFIIDADVFVDATNNIKIGVRQRQPVLRLIDNNGLNYYLDQDGIKMPLSKHFSARVLVASGNIPPHVPDFMERKKHLLKDLFELAQMLREDPFYNALIEQIHVSSRGAFTLIPKVGDQKINFGRYELAEKKLKNLKIFYQEGLPYEGWQKYRSFSVEFDGQVVARKR